MPSGAKKRKAAKKKKENPNPSHNHSDSAPAHSHGDDDVKHEKLLAEAEAGGASSTEGSRVGVEKDIKIEDESGVNDSIIDHNGENRKPYDGGSSGSCGSSSSSSDDENSGIKKGEAESSIASEVSVGVDDSLSGKPVESVCDSTVESIAAAIESDVLSQADISVAPLVVECTLEGNEGKKLGSVEERICTSVEEADVVGSAEITPKTLDPKECVTQENDDRSTLPRVALDNGAQCVKDSNVTQVCVASEPFEHIQVIWNTLHAIIRSFFLFFCSRWWLLLRIQFKKRRGKVAVDCLKCFRGLVINQRILLKQKQTLWLREVVEDVNEDLHHQNKELVLPFRVDLAVNIDIHFLVNYCSSTAP
ncbi:hypothetical protein SASPL_121513 [Salvia splendens]|uniref:Uncharacterized protein n=1 Tax=Salvia splendens TaxID=180675 RepID=A0A8X8ZUU3_SALSN|nr:hypothetical protein SASPL_121513 [Salvia splendens]